MLSNYSIDNTKVKTTTTDNQARNIAGEKSVRTSWPRIFLFHSENEDLDIDSPFITTLPDLSDNEECSKISECDSEEPEDKNNQGPTTSGEVDTEHIADDLISCTV